MWRQRTQTPLSSCKLDCRCQSTAWQSCIPYHTALLYVIWRCRRFFLCSIGQTLGGTEAGLIYNRRRTKSSHTCDTLSRLLYEHEINVVKTWKRTWTFANSYLCRNAISGLAGKLPIHLKLSPHKGNVFLTTVSQFCPRVICRLDIREL